MAKLFIGCLSINVKIGLICLLSKSAGVTFLQRNFLEPLVMAVKPINAFVQKLKATIDILIAESTQITLIIHIKTPAT